MQLVETRASDRVYTQLTMAKSAASSSSLSGTSPSEAEGTSRQSDSGHSDTSSPGSPLSTRRGCAILTASTRLNGPSSTLLLILSAYLA